MNSKYKEVNNFVGVRGFEPPAPASRTQCSCLAELHSDFYKINKFF